MSVRRIVAILQEEWYITISSLEVILDIFYYSFMALILYGFTTLFIAGKTNAVFAYYLITGLILWEIVRVAQYTLSVGALWEVWARNLTNIFISPITVSEYLTAQMLSGAFKSLFVFFAVSLLAIPLFHFNIFTLGLLNLTLFFINLVIFSWFTGIAILGLIFRFGTRVQALAWGLIILFQPLSASFFPVSVLPGPLQKIAHSLPTTYVFEAARNALSNPAVDWKAHSIAFALNIVYFSLSVLFFNYMFAKSKETGQFVKNEG